MPYDFTWHDEAHSIACIEMHGKITWEEWHDLNKKLALELSSTAHRLDFIFIDHVGLPPGNPIPHMKAAVERLNPFPNRGLLIHVSQPSISVLVRAFLMTILKATGTSLESLGDFVGTTEEALERIEFSRQENFMPDMS